MYIYFCSATSIAANWSKSISTCTYHNFNMLRRTTSPTIVRNISFLRCDASLRIILSSKIPRTFTWTHTACPCVIFYDWCRYASLSCTPRYKHCTPISMRIIYTLANIIVIPFSIFRIIIWAFRIPFFCQSNRYQCVSLWRCFYFIHWHKCPESNRHQYR